MDDDKHSSLSSQVIAGLFVAAILGAVSFIPGAFKWVVAIATDLWSHLRGTSEFPNWSLYLLALMSIHTFVHWTARVTKPKGPSVASYNHDTFLGLKWRWSYISGHPENAWAFCPHCDTVLVYFEVGSRFDPDRNTVLTCETCNRDLLRHEGDKDYLVQKIHRQIDRKIRTGEWQSVV
ncbi:MAG: hypothetical protein WC696_12360 [Candidatus Methylopumilus sp.]